MEAVISAVAAHLVWSGYGGYLESSGTLLVGTGEIQSARIATQTFLMVVAVLVERRWFYIGWKIYVKFSLSSITLHIFSAPSSSHMYHEESFFY